MKFLDGKLAPHIPELRRTPTKRPVGFFVVDDPECVTADRNDD
jgi:hypothetical protein